MTTIVRIEDCKQLGYCNHGLKAFGEKHNLDWQDFLENGISEEILLAVAPDDEIVLASIRVAKEREAKGL